MKNEFTGQITAAVDYGTIVVVRVETSARQMDVPFEHRAFRQMFEAESGDIIGRTCTVGNGGVVVLD